MNTENFDSTPMDLAWNVAAGAFTQDVQERLQRGFAAFVDAGGVVPLERCLRLPKSNTGVRLAQRKRWLAEVAKATDAPSTWARCVATSRALETFLSRGVWSAWKHMQDPPAGASQLRTALFYTAKFNDGNGISPRQVSRDVGHLFK
jgi:hypothetical protein